MASRYKQANFFFLTEGGVVGVNLFLLAILRRVGCVKVVGWDGGEVDILTIF